MSISNKFPHVIIVGVGRSGTTSLFRYLQQHPDVCVSSKKELAILFWEPKISSDELQKTYEKHFSNCPSMEKIRVEASPQYVLNPTQSASAILEHFPDAKLIFMLRNPVARTISVFRYFQKRKSELREMTFDQYIEKSLNIPYRVDDSVDLENNEHIWSEPQRGAYWLLLQPYFEHFPSDRIFVGFLEHLNKEPNRFMKNISSFVGVDAGFYDSFEYEIENKSISVKWLWLYTAALKMNAKFEPVLNRFPKIRSAVRRFHNLINIDAEEKFQMSDLSKTSLENLYKEPNLKLKSLLRKYYPGIDLPEWLQ